DDRVRLIVARLVEGEADLDREPLEGDRAYARDPQPSAALEVRCQRHRRGGSDVHGEVYRLAFDVAQEDVSQPPRMLHLADGLRVADVADLEVAAHLDQGGRLHVGVALGKRPRGGPQVPGDVRAQ